MPVLKTGGVFGTDPTDDKTGERFQDLFDTHHVEKQGEVETKLMTGTAKVAGTAVLVAGTVTVTTTAIKTGDHVRLTRQTIGGTVGNLSKGTIVNAVSFVITSSSNTDTSTVLWEIVRAQA